MTIYRGPGGTGEAHTDSDLTEFREIALEAEGYRDAAAASASSAANSATSSSTSASNASSSASSAASSASAASTSATNASNSASTATFQAGLAESARLAAQAAKTDAETAETNAAASAYQAQLSENAAFSSASSAASSASAAASSASAAATSATNAANASRLTVGTVTTGAAGSSASVTISGAAGSQVLDLTIPRGDTGATGPQGPQGPAGTSVDAYTKSEADSLLAAKQATLVSGTNIKTINGNSLLGSGDISISATGGVTSFNTRTGAVTLSSGDVTGALGFTPYDAANPSGYITSSALAPYLTSANAATTYQEKLLSGTNIKTFNNSSLLGSGNVSAVTSITLGTGIFGTGVPITSTGTIAIDTTVVATLTGTQTLTNKTLTDVTFNGAYIEDVFTIVDGASVQLDPSNGTIQLWTLGASRSPSATNFLHGESMTLMIDDGAAYTVTWPSVVWVGGSGPTLATTGYTVVELWKVGSTLYGALVGTVA